MAQHARALAQQGSSMPAPSDARPPWAVGSPDGAQEGLPSDDEQKQCQVKALFDMFGITPPADLQAEWESRDKDKCKKLKSELAAAAKYEEPSSQFYPTDEQLRQITAAAKVGYFVAQMLSEPSSKGDRVLANYIRSLLPVAHGGIWQFRQSPAAVLNEIGHIMDLSLNPKVNRAEADGQAVAWSLALRERLYKVSQARPLQAGDASMHNLWQEAFSFLESGNLPPSAATGANRSCGNCPHETPHKNQKDYCLWHSISNAFRKSAAASTNVQCAGSAVTERSPPRLALGAAQETTENCASPCRTVVATARGTAKGKEQVRSQDLGLGPGPPLNDDQVGRRWRGRRLSY